MNGHAERQEFIAESVEEKYLRTTGKGREWSTSDRLMCRSSSFLAIFPVLYRFRDVSNLMAALVPDFSGDQAVGGYKAKFHAAVLYATSRRLADISVSSQSVKISVACEFSFRGNIHHAWSGGKACTIVKRATERRWGTHDEN